jgi:NTE family protein
MDVFGHAIDPSASLRAAMPAHAKPNSTQTGPPIAGKKLVNLALQGVGSHGAFTWGVLDRLLEEERLAFDGISATSAGAVNAAVLGYGMAVGGREGAKGALDRYWRRLSEMTSASIFQPSFLDKMYGNFGLDHSPGYVFTNSLSQIFSPYQLNPMNYNPFKRLLEEVIDFEVLRRQSAVKLFLCATNVRSGKVKIFPCEELRSDHVVASSCQPLMMHAVAIDGEYYWDGGFMGNPPLFPVIYACEARDIILVHLTPTERPENPTTPQGDSQSHARADLQFVGHAGNAGRRFCHQAHRRGQHRRRQTNTHPYDRRRGHRRRLVKLQQIERRLGFSTASA